MTRLAHIPLALAAVLAASTDWGLVANDAPPICAKDRASCELALSAIERGIWAPDLRGAALRCEPEPGCFSERSLCIAEYNCEGGR